MSSTRNPRRSSILKMRNTDSTESGPVPDGGLPVSEELDDLTTKAQRRRVSFSQANQYHEFITKSCTSDEGSQTGSSTNGFHDTTFCGSDMSICDSETDYTETVNVRRRSLRSSRSTDENSSLDHEETALGVADMSIVDDSAPTGYQNPSSIDYVSPPKENCADAEVAAEMIDAGVSTLSQRRRVSFSHTNQYHEFKERSNSSEEGSLSKTNMFNETTLGKFSGLEMSICDTEADSTELVSSRGNCEKSSMEHDKTTYRLVDMSVVDIVEPNDSASGHQIPSSALNAGPPKESCPNVALGLEEGLPAKPQKKRVSYSQTNQYHNYSEVPNSADEGCLSKTIGFNKTTFGSLEMSICNSEADSCQPVNARRQSLRSSHCEKSSLEHEKTTFGLIDMSVVAEPSNSASGNQISSSEFNVCLPNETCPNVALALEEGSSTRPQKKRVSYSQTNQYHNYSERSNPAEEGELPSKTNGFNKTTFGDFEMSICDTEADSTEPAISRRRSLRSSRSICEKLTSDPERTIFSGADMSVVPEASVATPGNPITSSGDCRVTISHDEPLVNSSSNKNVQMRFGQPSPATLRDPFKAYRLPDPKDKLSYGKFASIKTPKRNKIQESRVTSVAQNIPALKITQFKSSSIQTSPWLLSSVKDNIPKDCKEVGISCNLENNSLEEPQDAAHGVDDIISTPEMCRSSKSSDMSQSIPFCAHDMSPSSSSGPISSDMQNQSVSYYDEKAAQDVARFPNALIPQNTSVTPTPSPSPPALVVGQPIDVQMKSYPNDKPPTPCETEGCPDASIAQSTINTNGTPSPSHSPPALIVEETMDVDMESFSNDESHSPCETERCSNAPNVQNKSITPTLSTSPPALVDERTTDVNMKSYSNDKPPMPRESNGCPSNSIAKSKSITPLPQTSPPALMIKQTIDIIQKSNSNDKPPSTSETKGCPSPSIAQKKSVTLTASPSPPAVRVEQSIDVSKKSCSNDKRPMPRETKESPSNSIAKNKSITPLPQTSPPALMIKQTIDTNTKSYSNDKLASPREPGRNPSARVVQNRVITPTPLASAPAMMVEQTIDINKKSNSNNILPLTRETKGHPNESVTQKRKNTPTSSLPPLVTPQNKKKEVTKTAHVESQEYKEMIAKIETYVNTANRLDFFAENAFIHLLYWDLTEKFSDEEFEAIIQRFAGCDLFSETLIESMKLRRSVIKD